MNNMKELILKNKAISIVVALLIIIFIIWLFRGNVKPDESKSLAKCLKDNGAKFYGSINCGYCKQQKAMFGEDAKDLPYIECTERSRECMDAKITGYPTWIFADGKRQSGSISLSQLKQMSGC